MSDTYTGNPSPSVVSDPTTQPDETAPTYTVPIDGDPLVAEDVLQVFRPMANLLARIKAFGTFIDRVKSWAGRQFLKAGLTVSLPASWLPTTSYTAYVSVVVNGGNVYLAIESGTSAGSGGPSGTATSITDGTVKWRYVQASPGTNALAVTGEVTVDGPLSTTNYVAVGANLDVGAFASITTTLTVGQDTFLNGANTHVKALAAESGTFTKGVTVTNSNTNANGTTTTGNGTGKGLRAVGGSGGGAGAELQGGTGAPGAVVTAGTAATASTPQTALSLGNGYLSFSGAAMPNSNVGFANTLGPNSFAKAHCVVEIVSGTPTIQGKAKNVSGVSIVTNIGLASGVLRVTFATPMASQWYTALPKCMSASLPMKDAALVSVTANYCDIAVFTTGTGGTVVDLSSGDAVVSVGVFGDQ